MSPEDWEKYKKMIEQGEIAFPQHDAMYENIHPSMLHPASCQCYQCVFIKGMEEIFSKAKQTHGYKSSKTEFELVSPSGKMRWLPGHTYVLSNGTSYIACRPHSPWNVDIVTASNAEEGVKLKRLNNSPCFHAMVAFEHTLIEMGGTL